MKLVLQIALGVFIGALGAQAAFEGWRSYEAKKQTEAVQARMEEQRRQREAIWARIRGQADKLSGAQEGDRKPNNVAPVPHQGDPNP